MPKVPDRVDRTRPQAGRVYVPTSTLDGPPRDKTYYETLRGLGDTEVVRRAGATVYTRDALEELLARLQRAQREVRAQKIALDALNDAYTALKADQATLAEQFASMMERARELQSKEKADA